GMSQAVSQSQSGANRIVSTFRAMRGPLASAGSFAMSGLTAGIMGGAGSAIAAARSIANSVSATIRSAMKIHSPSRVMMVIGEFISEGLGVGMLDMVNYLVKSASQVAGSVTEALTPQAPSLEFLNESKR